MASLENNFAFWAKMSIKDHFVAAFPNKSMSKNTHLLMVYVYVPILCVPSLTPRIMGFLVSGGLEVQNYSKIKSFWYFFCDC